MKKRTRGFWFRSVALTSLGMWAALGTAGATSPGISDELDHQHELEEQVVRFKRRVKDDRLELKSLQVLNQKLCQRLAKLRSECAPAIRLVPETNGGLSCFGNTENGTPSLPKYTVLLTGGESRSFFLQANGQQYYSTDFPSDVETEITWATRFDANKQSPRLLNLTDMRLRARDGKDIPPTVRMELRLNGTALATQLVAQETSAQFFHVSLNEIRAFQDSAQCKVSPTELATLREEAKAEAKAAQQADDDDGADESAQVKFVTERIFRAIFRRYPVSAMGEDLKKSPLLEAAKLVEQEEYEGAAKAILKHPSFSQLLPGMGDPVSDNQLANAIAVGIFQGILDATPDAGTADSLAERVKQGERAAVIAELIRDQRFQEILRSYME